MNNIHRTKQTSFTYFIKNYDGLVKLVA